MPRFPFPNEVETHGPVTGHLEESTRRRHALEVIRGPAKSSIGKTMTIGEFAGMDSVEGVSKRTRIPFTGTNFLRPFFWEIP